MSLCTFTLGETFLRVLSAQYLSEKQRRLPVLKPQQVLSSCTQTSSAIAKTSDSMCPKEQANRCIHDHSPHQDIILVQNLVALDDADVEDSNVCDG